MVYAYNRILFSLKGKKLIDVIIWRNLEDIILSEIR
jgi:hypothetical protein